MVDGKHIPTGPLLAAGILVLALLVAFVPSLESDFAPLDDGKNFLANPHYRGLAPANLRWMFTTNHMGHYIPLTWITLGLDYLMWGLKPFGYHLTSLVFHLLNALLFLFLARRLLLLREPSFPAHAALGGALAAALFFAAHPLRVESVVWISERRDVVCGFFSLLALNSYLSATSGRGLRRLLACSLLFVCALLSKGIALALPVVFLALDATVLRRLPPRPRLWLQAEHRHVLLEKIPFLAIALASAVATTLSIRYVMSPLSSLGLDARLAALAKSLTFYVQKTLLPWPLPPILPRTARVSLATPEFALSGVVLLATVAILIAGRRRFPGTASAAIAYAAFVLPVSGLVQAGPQLVAHRYSYLSCWPWAFLLGVGVQRLLVRPGRTVPAVTLAISAVVATGLVMATRAQARIWRDPYSFATAAVAGAPEASQPRYTLAGIHLRAGRWEEAARQIRIGLLHNPAAQGLMNLAGLLFATCPDPQVRSPREALLQATRLTRETEFRDAWALFTLSAALAENGEYRAAAEAARRAQAIAEGQGIPGLVRRLGAALPLYESGRPLRMAPADWGEDRAPE